MKHMVVMRKMERAVRGGLEMRVVILITACAAFFVCGNSHAEPSRTEARGYYTVKVPGAPELGATARTYLGIQLLPTPHWVGLVSAVDGFSVELQGMADPLRPSYLHVMDGNGPDPYTQIQTKRAACLRID